MALFKAFRGNRASLDVLEKHDGYAYFCVDDGSFHIDFVDSHFYWSAIYTIVLIQGYRFIVCRCITLNSFFLFSIL